MNGRTYPLDNSKLDSGQEREETQQAAAVAVKREEIQFLCLMSEAPTATRS